MARRKESNRDTRRRLSKEVAYLFTTHTYIKYTVVKKVLGLVITNDNCWLMPKKKKEKKLWFKYEYTDKKRFIHDELK